MKNVVLLTLNAPTLNGRTYTTEVVLAALEKLGPDKPLLGTTTTLLTGFPNISDASFVVSNRRIEGDSVFGDLSFLPGSDEVRSKIESGEFWVRLSGTGFIDHDLRVFDYTILAAAAALRGVPVPSTPA